MQQLPPALAPLGAYRQFIGYRLTPDKSNPGKTKKWPVSIHDGSVHDAHDPTIWVGFDEAASWAQRAGSGHGVGFVFTANDPFWFLDIDEAYDEQKQEWSATARAMSWELDGCAIEVSQSGRGLHIFGTGTIPPHSCDNKILHAQFFTERRFVALTGTGIRGDAGLHHPAIVPFVQRHFPFSMGSLEDNVAWWSDEPVPEWRGPEDDTALLERALRSASAASVMGTRARFADLWNADAVVLGPLFPPDRPGDAYNPSEVDQALAQHLAFWTGNNAERMERLMRQSALKRDKWDQRDDYLPRTIRKACGWQKDWLQDAPPAASPFEAQARAAATQQPVAQVPVRVTDSTILHPDDQVTFFAGCVYVTDEHKVMVPDGSLLDSARFNARYGGRVFVMNAENTKTTRKAFEAFTESQVYKFPRADSTCFRPLRAPGELVREDSRVLVNTWVSITVDRAKGDVTRFFDHVAKMIPDERDRWILLGYMATVVQHQGHKLQWAPLVQGTTGNGKGMISTAVKRAIGKPYCHSPKPSQIGNDFNAWLAGRTFYAVDEIYVPEKRLDLLEVLKPLITEGEGLEVTKKGVDSGMRDVCGNFMFLTNHRDGLRMSQHDRRIAPFFTAQQYPPDLARDGMPEDYFVDLFAWLKGEGKYAGQTSGYAMVAEWLWTWEIPREFDARFHPRAPKTTSTEQALVVGRGRAEQEVAEAIEQQEVGFRGGWISSGFLRKAIERSGVHMALSKHADVASALGYMLHPGLKEGRVNNRIDVPDAGRPRLYVLRTAEHLLKLGGPAEIAAAYVAAQQG